MLNETSDDVARVFMMWQDRAQAAVLENQQLRAERDALQAAITRVRALHVIDDMGECIDCRASWPCPTRLALDASGGTERTCPRCKGSMVEPGTATRHYPHTGKPCTDCYGTGRTPESPEEGSTDA